MRTDSEAPRVEADPALGRQLPHLIRLLDDESPAVKSAVDAALARLAPDLESIILELGLNVEDAVRLELRRRSALLPFSRFETGDLVEHVRYGYRGVVVARDPRFCADEEWYASKTTQPSRDQPWYHVLVDRTAQVTYAAQTSLRNDRAGGTVLHPKLAYFFADFQDGRYIRNDRPWTS